MNFAYTKEAMAAPTLLPDPMPGPALRAPSADDGESLCTDRDAAAREAYSQLTLGIVHELNNLTGGIFVLSEIYLQDDCAGMPTSEGLELIHKSTSRLQTLVHHLKIVHGPLRQDPTYVDLGANVRALLDVFAPALPKGTTIETDFGGEQLAVYVDEALFRQALLAITLEIAGTLAAHPSVGHGVRITLHRLGNGRVELVLAPTDAAGVDLRVEHSGSTPRFARAQAALAELDATLVRGSHGEYLIEMPLVD